MSSSNDGPSGRLWASLSEENIIALGDGEAAASLGLPGPSGAADRMEAELDVESIDTVRSAVSVVERKRKREPKPLVILEMIDLPPSQKLVKTQVKNVPSWARNRKASASTVESQTPLSSQGMSTFSAAAAAQKELVEVEEVPVEMAKRGRGRPPSTGEFVSLAESKDRLAQASRDELSAHLEKQLIFYGVQPPSSKTYERKASNMFGSALANLRHQPTVDLRSRVLEQMDVVEGMSRIHSGSTKGPMTRALQLAAAKTRAMINVLIEREEDNGSAENASLRIEVVDLRAQVEQLKATVATLSKTPLTAPLPVTTSGTEEMHPVKRRGRLTRRVAFTSSEEDGAKGRQVPAREEKDPTQELEDRLFVRLERLIESKMGVPSERRQPIIAEEDDLEVPILDYPVLAPSQQERRAVSQSPDLQEAAQAKRSFAEAAKQKRGGKITGTPAGPSAGRPVTTGKVQTAPKPKAKVSREAVKSAAAPNRRALQPNRAVSLTVIDGRYTEVLSLARQKIQLREETTEGTREKPPQMKARRTLTGGYMFEFAGDQGEADACRFADKLKGLFHNNSNVRISMPCRKVELHIRRIVESTTVREVIEAICEAGGCSPQDVTAGNIVRASDRLGLMWVRVPEGVGSKLLETGRVQIGWCQAVITALNPRKLQCYKCLQYGHVKLTCTNEDRSDSCYRCGIRGHRARDCDQVASCIVCKERGLPSNHRMGGKSCRMPEKGKGRKAKRGGWGPGAATKGGQVPDRPPPSSTPPISTQEGRKDRDLLEAYAGSKETPGVPVKYIQDPKRRKQMKASSRDIPTFNVQDPPHSFGDGLVRSFEGPGEGATAPLPEKETKEVNPPIVGPLASVSVTEAVSRVASQYASADDLDATGWDGPLSALSDVTVGMDTEEAPPLCDLPGSPGMSGTEEPELVNSARDENSTSES